MNFKALLYGGSGITLTEVVELAPVQESGDSSQTVNSVIQIIIGVVTLFKMFKSKKAQ